MLEDVQLGFMSGLKDAGKEGSFGSVEAMVKTYIEYYFTVNIF